MATNKNLVIKIDVDSNGATTAFKAIREEVKKVTQAIESIDDKEALVKLREQVKSIVPAFKKQADYLQEFQAKLDKLSAGKMPEILQPATASRMANAYTKHLATLAGQIRDAVKELDTLDKRLAQTKGEPLSKYYKGGANLKQTLIKGNLIDTEGEGNEAAHAEQEKFIQAALKQQAERLKDLDTISSTLDKANKKGLVEYNNQQEKQDQEITKDREKFSEAMEKRRAKRQADIDAFRQQANENITATGIDPVGLQRRQRQDDIEAAFRARDERNAQVERRLQDATQARRNRSQAALGELTGTNVDQQRVQLEVANANAIRLDGERSYRARRAQYALESFNAERAYEADLARIRREAQSGTLRAPQAAQQRNTALANYRTAMQGLPDLNEPIKQHQSLFLRVAALTAAYRTLNMVTGTFVNGLKSVPKVGIELDSARASLEATTGSLAGAESSLKALDAEANRTGINIATLRENFKGFQASTSLAGASLESTWNMFTNLNSVITGLHLSADKANGVFLAMAQIFNKGRVQSEELVKQLGNLLPGAFASFAKSMGILPAELSKQMKAGLVEANAIAENGKTIMENFTAYMAERLAPAFASAANGYNANLERMHTSTTHLAEAIYSEMQPTFISVVKTVTEATDSLTNLVNGTDKLSDTMSNVLKAALLVATTGFVGLAIQAGKSVVAINLAKAALSAFSPMAVAVTAVGAAFLYVAQQANEASRSISKAEEAYKKGKQAEFEAAETLNKATTPLNIQMEEDNVLKEKNTEYRKAAEETKKYQKELADYKSKAQMLQARGMIGPGEVDSEIDRLTKLELSAREARDRFGQDVTERTKFVIDEMEAAKAKERASITEAHAKDTSSWVEATSQYEQEPGSTGEAKIVAGQKFDAKNKKILSEATAFVRTYENIAKRKASGEKVEEGVQGSEENYNDAKQAIANIEAGRASAINEAVKKVQDRLERQAAVRTKAEMRAELSKEKAGAGVSTAEAKADIEELTTQYVEHKVTIEKYYAEKQKIQLKDLEFQKGMVEKEIETAKKGNDAVRQSKLEGQLSTFDEKARIIKAKNEQDAFKAQEALDKKAGASGSSAGKEAVRVDLKEQENAVKLLTKETKSELEQLDTAYKANKVSIYTYYAKTLNIQLAALDKKKQIYEQERQVALKSSNDVKATELSGKIAEIEPERETLLQNVAQSKVAALDDYNNKLQQALSEEEQLMGSEEEGALVKFKQQHKDFKEKLDAILAEPLTDENAGAKADAIKGLHAYQTGLTHAGLAGSLSGIEKSANMVLKQHQESKQNIEQMQESGAYSPMYSQLKLMQENKQAVADYEKELAKAEKEQEAVIARGEKPAEQDQLRIQAMRTQLSTLKKEARNVGDEVVNSMGKAFDSSFANLLDGAANGKMAFKQFAISVEQDLASIAAAEIRSAIFNSLGLTSATGIGGGGLLKMLGGAFSSVLGGAMGGAAETASIAATTNSAGFTSMFSAANAGSFWTKNAMGGVYTSSDLSQHSGSLVSSPTLFKFANGSSTGLMGEAGPEFILPAERMKNGKMGIRATGGGMGGGVTIKNMSVSLQQAPNSTPAQQSEQIAKGIRKQLTTMIQQQTANNLRSGNLLNPTQMQVGI